MAALLMIAGGVVGFASALASLVLLNTSVLMALAIWSGVGTLMLMLGLVFALAPSRAASRAKVSEPKAQTAG